MGSTRETGIRAYERRRRVLHAVANCSDCLFANLFLAETILVLSIHCRGIIDLTTRLNFNQSTLPLIDHKNRKRILQKLISSYYKGQKKEQLGETTGRADFYFSLDFLF